MKLVFDQNSRSFPIDLMPVGKAYRATMENRTVEVEIVRSEEGRLDLLIDGKPVTAYISSENARRWVTVDEQTVVLTRSSGARKGGQGSHHAAGDLTAPMPGQIRAVNVREGESVTKGQTLLVVEAMKMEIRLHAPFDGVVSSIAVKAGQTVEREQFLIKMDHG